MSKNYNNTISKEGEEFILNLNMYLMSTGKSDDEIKEFIDEAEQHLILGEQEGKSVEDIFGSSPEEYAKSVAEELSFSKKELLEAAFIFILGFGSWIFLSQIKDGIVTMSVIEAILTPIVYLVTIISLVFITRKFAFNDKKLFIGLFILFFISISSSVIIAVVGESMEQSIVINRLLVMAIVSALFVLSIMESKKIGAWYLMMAFIFYLPTIIESFTNIDFGDNILVTIIPLILCVIFSVLQSKLLIKSND